MTGHWRDIVFMYPNVLWALLLIPLLIAWYALVYRKKKPALIISNTSGVNAFSKSWKHFLMHGMYAFRMLALALIIVALARPYIPNFESQVETEGIDIVITLDISSSMLAKDFKPNRLEAAKEVAKEFIEQRKNDRIGMVVFGGEAFTQCPITIDHQILTGFMDDIKSGMLEDGTAIGSGLGVAVNRLKDSEVNSKVVILLTDGVNNAGAADPMTIAELATKYNIRVYTIGVGKKGKAYSPVGRYADGSFAYEYVEVEIDEDLLKNIASQTGGKYFRATDNESLRSIYQEIDQMEKSRVRVSALPKPIDQFFWPVLLALGLLTVELLIKNTLLRSIT
jgi:Ca-activated chloride channel homolog